MAHSSPLPTKPLLSWEDIQADHLDVPAICFHCVAKGYARNPIVLPSGYLSSPLKVGSTLRKISIRGRVAQVCAAGVRCVHISVVVALVWVPTGKT